MLLGGIIIANEKENELKNVVEGVKADYGDARAPMKWNFRDLKKMYSTHDRLDLWKGYMNNMHDFRCDLFSAVSDIDFKVIVSAVQSYSSDKEQLKKLKNDLTGRAFANGLMKYALHARDISPQRPEVIMDWPDGNNGFPFNQEYVHAYNYGQSVDNVRYLSGPLSKLSFEDSINYRTMAHSTLLQLSDMIVGATREFIEHSINGKKNGQGVELMGTIRTKYRGYPNHVIKRGIFFNSNAKSCIKATESKFRQLFVEPYVHELSV
jgi:hypothetical protein